MIIRFTFPEHLKMFMEFLQEPGEKKISKKTWQSLIYSDSATFFY